MMEAIPVPTTCNLPRWSKKTNEIIDVDTEYALNEQDRVIVKYDVLDSSELEEYIEEARKVERVSGKSAYGSTKPRREVCYTPDGEPYYTRVKNTSQKSTRSMY